jgi:hypothetical protein
MKLKDISKKLVAGLTLFTLLLLFISYSLAVTVNVKSAGKVTKLIGPAQIKKEDKGNWLPLKQGMFVDVKDRVQVSKDAKLELTFVDGTKLRMGGNTDLNINQYKPGSKDKPAQSFIKLNKGKVWAKVAKGKNKLGVQGKMATCMVAGTCYRMESNNESTSTTVYEGAVGIHLPFENVSEEQISNTLEKFPQLKKEETSSSPKPFETPTVVEGPKEIPCPVTVVPGPREVSMTEWLQIVENQQIIMKEGGKAVISEIDPKKENQDEWIKWNEKLDKE